MKKISIMVLVISLIASYFSLSIYAAEPVVLNPIPDQKVVVGSMFYYQFPENTFYDAEHGYELTYEAILQDGSSLPSWLNFDTEARSFDGIFPGDSISVRIIAYDGDHNETFDAFDIIPNTPPRRKSNVNSSDVASVKVNTEYKLDLSEIFEDLNGDNLTYKVKIEDNGYVNADKQYTFTPTTAKSYTLIFIADDGYQQSLDSYTVILTANIVNAETPSITNDLQDVSGYRGDNITLDATATISDEGEISYQWYTCDNSSKANPQVINNATSAMYQVDTSSPLDTFIFCKITNTNTNSNINGNQIATIDTQIAHVTVTNPQLIGSIGIDNTTPKYGDTLTASITGDNSDTDNFTYQWYRGNVEIAGATSAIYTVSENDIDKLLTVKVTVSDCFGTLETSTNVVEKADAIITPNAVTTSSITHNSITVQPQNDVEFTCVNDGVTIDDNTKWQTTLNFTGLTEDTEYDLYARAKETQTYKASIPSVKTDVKTITLLLVGNVTVTGNPVYGEELQATVSNSNALGTLAYQWKGNGINILNATMNKYILTVNEIGKTITCEVSDTDIGNGAKLGSIESVVTAQVDKVMPTKPNAPTNQNKTHNSVTLTPIQGCEYSIDGGNRWQDSNVFTGLTASTTYTFIQREKESDINYTSQESSPVSITTNPQPSSGGSGNSSSTKVDTSKEKLEKAIKDSKQNDNGYKKVEVRTEPDKKGKAKIELPKNFAGNKVKAAINAGDVKVTIDGTMFTGKEKKVELVIEPVELAGFENQTVYDISLNIDSKNVDWSSGTSMEIEFKLYKDNKENHKFVAVYIDDEGNVHVLKNSYLNKQILKFSTKHLSHYGVMYIEKSFIDTDSHWVREAVEALAAREVIKGKPEGIFAPDDIITKAEFVALVVRYFDMVSLVTDCGFVDVEEGIWFAEPVLVARELQILPEIYGNTFEPNKAITREEMMYILHKALVVSGENDKLTGESINLDTFSDINNISNYALESVKYLISRDIIHGYNGKINPTVTSTRAEVAQMLYNILKK